MTFVPLSGRQRSSIDAELLPVNSRLSRRTLIGAGGFLAASAAVADTLAHQSYPVIGKSDPQGAGAALGTPVTGSRIVSAAIEPNGWVLRIKMYGALASVVTTPDTPTVWASNFASYALAPDSSAPAITITMTSNGFVPSAGMAVASSTVARSVTGTKVLRRPVIALSTSASRFAKTPDEVDNGDGTITVRVALSQYIYTGDSALSLSLLAGWRSGASATSNIIVQNNSTVAAPAPIVRWSDIPYQLQNGRFGLEVAVASHHPNGLAPVAGVKFTVTDGVNVKTYWATALSTSTSYRAGGTGQPLRVYSATVDPATATALTKGLLRCDFEVYPWIGPVQKSDAVGTRSMTNLGTAALATSAFVPFVVAYNPDNKWITPRYVYVNAQSGATTPSAANVSLDPALAAARPLASINLAIESLRLWSVANAGGGGTLAAANGQPAVPQSLDGCRIRLMAGVTLGTGPTTVSYGANTSVSWLVVEGDPSDPSPVANCILRAPPTAGGQNNITRVRFANLSVEAGPNKVFGCGAVWLDGFQYRNVSGSETQVYAGFGTTNGLIWATNGQWWRCGQALTYQSYQTPITIRNVTTERNLLAPLVANCSRLATAVPGSQGFTAVFGSIADPGLALERIAVGNDLRYLNNVSSGGALGINAMQLANANAPASLTLGTAYPVVARCAAINNVGEVYGAASTMWGAIGESTALAFSEVIVEGNTFAGDRVPTSYNDLRMPTIAQGDLEDVKLRLFRYANNVNARVGSKHDAYDDPLISRGDPNGFPKTSGRIGVALGTSWTRGWTVVVGNELVIAGSPANVYRCSQSGTTSGTPGTGPTGARSGIVDGSAKWDWIATETRQHGYRPQATGAWASHYGVMYEGNIDLMGAGDVGYTPDFTHEYYGLGSKRIADDAPSLAKLTAMPFNLDRSGTVNRLDCQAPGTGGGDYRPLSYSSGRYLMARARSANVDIDQVGTVRTIPFAAGALNTV